MAQFVTLDLQNGRPPIRKTQIAGLPPYRRHATFILDGIQSSGKRPGSDIKLLLLSYGDVVVVRYPRFGGFDAEQFIRDTLEATLQYEEVTFLGLSFGGLFGHDVIAEAKARGTTTTFKLAPVDSPASVNDLYMRRGAQLMAHVHGIRRGRLLQLLMFNQLSLESFPPRFVPKPAPYVGELTKRQKAELAEHVCWSADSPLGPWLDQLRYIVRHHGPQVKTLQDVDAVFVRSTHDDIVKDSAHGAWNEAYEAACGRSLPAIIVDSPHVGLMERPAKWEAVIRRLFEALDIHPLYT